MADAATKLTVKNEDKPVQSTGNVWSPFEALRGEIDRLFDEFVPSRWRATDRSLFGRALPSLAGWAATPAVDVVEKDDTYEVTAEFPGLDEKNIEVKLSNGFLTIRGEKKEEKEDQQKEYHISERRYGSFQEGVVPGGGLALLRCVSAVAAEEDRCTGDERTGVQILKHALEAPARQIAENSAVDGGVVVARMLESKGAIGFDAANNRYVDLFEEGIIDPTKVVRVALENAVSVASVLLLTEATMTEIPEPIPPQPPVSMGI